MEVKVPAGSGSGQQDRGPHVSHPGASQGPLQQTSHRHLRGDPGHQLGQLQTQEQEGGRRLHQPLSLAVRRPPQVSGGEGDCVTSARVTRLFYSLTTNNKPNISRKSNFIKSKLHADNIFIKLSADVKILLNLFETRSLQLNNKSSTQFV